MNADERYDLHELNCLDLYCVVRKNVHLSFEQFKLSVVSSAELNENTVNFK